MLRPSLSALDERPFLGLVLRPGSEVADALDTIERWGASHGKSLVDLSGEIRKDGAETEADGNPGECSLVFALGGDGTVLRALALAAPVGTPVLGVNFGTLGFLTEVAATQIEAGLQMIDSGRGRLEERLAMRVDALAAQAVPRTLVAYNDAVISRRPGHGAAAVAVRVEGSVFARFAADAVIASTATGSTAYAFAAGGPLISPTLAAVAITPVAPHGPYNRSLIVDASHELAMEVLADSDPAALEIDGRLVTVLDPGSGIRISPAPEPARLLRVSPSSFYERARKRLGVDDSAVLRPELRRAETRLDVLLDASHGGSENAGPKPD
jgi:NAD+ kinase